MSYYCFFYRVCFVWSGDFALFWFRFLYCIHRILGFSHPPHYRHICDVLRWLKKDCISGCKGTLGNNTWPPLSFIQIGFFPRAHKLRDACSAKGQLQGPAIFIACQGMLLTNKKLNSAQLHSRDIVFQAGRSPQAISLYRQACETEASCTILRPLYACMDFR